MTLTLLAYIKEDANPTNLFGSQKEPILYYRVGQKVHCFNYKKIQFELVYESKYRLNCMIGVELDNFSCQILGNEKGHIEVLDRKEGVVERKTFHDGAEVACLSFTNHYLLSMDNNRGVVLYNMAKKQLVCEFSLSTSHANAQALLQFPLSPSQVLVGDHEFGSSLVSHMGTADQEFSYPDEDYDPVSGYSIEIAQGTSSTNFLSLHEDGQIKLWKQSLGDEEVSITRIKKWKGHTRAVPQVAVFKDGSFASASWDGSVKVWSGRKDVKVAKVANNGCCTVF